MESKYMLENILLLFGYIIGTMLIGGIFGIFSLLISYAVLTELFASNLVPTNPTLYNVLVVSLEVTKTILGWLTGGRF